MPRAGASFSPRGLGAPLERTGTAVTADGAVMRWYDYAGEAIFFLEVAAMLYFLMRTPSGGKIPQNPRD